MSSKLNHIKEGWSNYFENGDNPTEEEKRRAEICSSCDFKKHGKILMFVKDKLSNIEGHYCGVCTCPLSALIRSGKGCEKKKW